MTGFSKLLVVFLQMSLFLFLIGNGSDEMDKQYKEPCLKNSECASSEHLTCIMEFCVCKPNMYWDKDDRKCKIKVGKRCVSFDGAALGICTPRSYCDVEDTKTCICQMEDEEATIAGYCMKKHNAQCNHKSGDYCNPDKLLFCSNEGNVKSKSRCKCKDENEMIFRNGSCMGKIGEMCELHSWADAQLNCFENAECIPDDENYGTCRCKPEFESSQDKTECFAVVGTQCALNSDCASGKFLSCQNRVCQCDPNQAIFDAESFTCKLKFNEFCDIYKNDCYKNSWCSIQKCICEEGFIASEKERLCRLSHQAVCVKDAECNEQIGLKCSFDPYLGLKTCTCQNEYKIFENGECKSKIGFPCSESSKCTKHGICLGGICKCERHYKEFNNVCHRAHLAPCENDQDCYSFQVRNLHCGSEGKCICNPATTYDPIAENCLVRIGESCLELEGDCVKNGFCSSELSYLSRCECQGGFTPTNDMTSCLKNFGEECERREECNNAAQLGCFDGKCGCLPGQRTFDHEIRMCVGLLGTRCNYEENFKCVERAFCKTNIGGVVNGDEGICVCEDEGYSICEKSMAGVGKSRNSIADYQTFIFYNLLALCFVIRKWQND